ncbi:hypothetical protein J8L84_19960 [Alteromonas sp. MMG017]|uniref:hypothetical protein n=1 Tax=Alteromonas sp. MMG017 TaxID=2822692 RepID=UPI001B3A0DC9|nr:hypothetical protein [Alteromonas sp. MMG017]MBQ4831557.1 hypothetical protein [Alteromonas sp. MMG017]
MFLVFLTVVLPVQSRCFLRSEFVNAAISFKKSLSSVKSYIVYSGSSDVTSYSGAVTSFPLTNYFTALRLEPENLEKSAFIFAVDLKNESFYAYYTNGVSKPFPNYTKGKVSLENCSINFDISDTEQLLVKVHEKGEIEIISQSRTNTSEAFSLSQQFIFSSNEYAN